MMNGLSKHPSSFRQGLPERERGDAAGVFRPKPARANGAWSRRGLSQPGCNSRRRKVRRDHALILFQNVENGALRPSPHSSGRMMPP